MDAELERRLTDLAGTVSPVPELEQRLLDGLRPRRPRRIGLAAGALACAVALFVAGRVTAPQRAPSTPWQPAPGARPAAASQAVKQSGCGRGGLVAAGYLAPGGRATGAVFSDCAAYRARPATGQAVAACRRVGGPAVRLRCEGASS